MLEDALTAETDDLSLALRMMEGDEQALAFILRRDAPGVTTALRSRYTGVPEYVLDDAVNRAAHTLWKKASEFDDKKGSWGALFYRCAINEVINILREGKNADFVSIESLPDKSTTGEVTQLTPKKKAQYDDLHACIAAFPPLQRDICEADLSAGCDADNAYLAEVHHTTKNSIYVSRNKAREKIRLEMLKLGHFK